MDNTPKPHKSKRGRGTVYEKNGAWHLQFYTREMRKGALDQLMNANERLSQEMKSRLNTGGDLVGKVRLLHP